RDTTRRAWPCVPSAAVTADKEAFSPNGDGVAESAAFIPEISATEGLVAWTFSILPAGNGAQVGLSFSGDGTELRYDGQGGEVMPGAGQVEGSSADWQTIQHYVRVADARGQTILSIPRVPLVQLGGLNLGAWRYVPEIPRPHVFSWVMNNYWWTNFRASQGGEWSWTCSLTSTEESSRAVAARFGAECHSPLIARLERVAKLETRSRILVTPGNVLAVEMRPERGGDGIILQLRELDGQDTTCRIEVPDGISAPRAEEVDVTGRPLRPLPDHMQIPGFGVRFVRLALR
ncbi:MAG TPA: hypothetical protein PKM22_12555, partial [Candidatus Hydrogenedentes bacterium]|nr:hypothetical protein [Candidatus Hydrogenedentota bacterium]